METCRAGHPNAYQHADLLLKGEKVGSVHQNGFAPRWAFQISKFRAKYMWNPSVCKSSPTEQGSLANLLFDGAAYASPEEARKVVEGKFTTFLQKLAEAEDLG